MSLMIFFTLYFMNNILWCAGQKQNFLLIIVDDLRTSLGSYGDGNAHTPNIDRLAREAAIFSQAFAQVSIKLTRFIFHIIIFLYYVSIVLASSMRTKQKFIFNK